jgi:hypothetical protein
LEALRKVRDWLKHHGKNHDVGYFFENRSENRGEVESVMKYVESRPNLREQFRYATWGWVPKTAAPAQAADMLAYEVWKECVNGLLMSSRKYSMRRSLKALTHMVPNFTYCDEKTWEAERRRRVQAASSGETWP